MWLIVEVVPRATPFLLSIETMKHLGTVIDLQKSTCFLKVLDKQIDLQKGKTGLLMIQIADLCKKPKPSQSIFGASSDLSTETPFVEHHAHTRRDASDGQEHRRARGSESSDTPDDPVEPSGNPSVKSGGSDKSGIHDERAFERGPEPAREDRGTGHDDERKLITSSERRRIHCPDGERCGSMGPRGSHVSDSAYTTKANSGHGSKVEPSITDQVDGSWKRSLPSPKHIESADFKSGWNRYAWKPTASEPSDRSQSKHSTSPSDTGIGMDNYGHGPMGPKDSELGKEASWKAIRCGLRERLPVCELVPESHELPRSSDQRLRSLLPDSPADGIAIAPEPGSFVEWETLVTDLLIRVETELEAKLLKVVNLSKPSQAYGKPIDLLEVYAQPNSKLAEEVIRQGGKAERFTQEHGDLSTFQGKVQLLEMICRLRPKHVWVAPECHPWCAWNRFNAGRSMKLYEKIQKSKELSKEHLELCTLICKIQVQYGRHFTMENPGTSDIWKQQEMKSILSLTKTVHLDQCKFGLVHPEDHRPLKKFTRLQTTSNEVVNNMDGRFCDKKHQHSQIAGSCKFQGERMALSRFAAFYPRVFARVAARSTLQETQKSTIPVIEEEDLFETFPAESEENPAKRPRIEPPREPKRKAEPSDPEKTLLTDPAWEDVFCLDAVKSA